MLVVIAPLAVMLVTSDQVPATSTVVLSGPVVAALVVASPSAFFPTTVKVIPELSALEVRVTVCALIQGPLLSKTKVVAVPAAEIASVSVPKVFVCFLHLLHLAFFYLL